MIEPWVSFNVFNARHNVSFLRSLFVLGQALCLLAKVFFLFFIRNRLCCGCANLEPWCLPREFFSIYILVIVLSLISLEFNFLRYHILALNSILINSHLRWRIFAIILLNKKIRVLVRVKSAIAVSTVEMLILVHKGLSLVWHVVFEKSISCE